MNKEKEAREQRGEPACPKYKGRVRNGGTVNLRHSGTLWEAQMLARGIRVKLGNDERCDSG